VYRWVDHTAELELHIDADSEAGVFRDALHALADLASDDGTEPMCEAWENEGGALAPERPERLSREVSVSAPDRAAVLAAWMDELVYLGESEGLVAEEADCLAMSDGGITASVCFRHGAPPHLVKGVTYHQLAFTDEGDRFHATVVLDV
jgi:SHS2 domain-containing protein